jgi:hypothetical protein
VTKLAKDYGIRIQTIHDKEQQNEIEFVRDCDSGAGPSNCKSMKKSSYEEVDLALLRCFNQKRAEGTSVSGPMCCVFRKPPPPPQMKLWD